MKTILEIIRESQVNECGGPGNGGSTCGGYLSSGSMWSRRSSFYDEKYSFSELIDKKINYRKKAKDKDHKCLEILKKFEDVMFELVKSRDMSKINKFIDRLDNFLKETD